MKIKSCALVPARLRRGRELYYKGGAIGLLRVYVPQVLGTGVRVYMDLTADEPHDRDVERSLEEPLKRVGKLQCKPGALRRAEARDPAGALRPTSERTPSQHKASRL